jgi:SagB-type dehydrogenase family enzyme
VPSSPDPPGTDDAGSVVRRYHDGTKHQFHRFARSLGYLDWASQPHPFRSYAGAPAVPLFPAPDAADVGPRPARVPYDALFDGSAPTVPLSATALGDLLRHALGLSAWKVFGASRWSLRVNPSSGNLHPTEAYVVCGPVDGLSESAAVFHYAPDRHVLERRCAFDAGAWGSACGGDAGVVLVALTSIHWREAWKYGERAFRYCQHDLGHAIAALALAASLLGWRARLLPGWSHRAVAVLAGVDRDLDFVDAEREEPACLIGMGPGAVSAALDAGSAALVDAIRGGRWTGRASQLSEDHVQWTFIDEVAAATEYPGAEPSASRRSAGLFSLADACGHGAAARRDAGMRDARALILQRRSAVAFDGRSAIDRDRFRAMLLRAMPSDGAPWQALWWTPRIHLLLFVHRVDGLVPGLYLLPRDPEAVVRLRAATAGREFLWEDADLSLPDVAPGPPLVRLARGDCRRLSGQLSCGQEIAADGFFSLGMIAEFDASLDACGPAFYRHLFWESGVVGQALYLEAEACGARATGIGCFFDDPVHDILGLDGHLFQSLYHFTVGVPIEDARLTTAPGYDWEAADA